MKKASAPPVYPLNPAARKLAPHVTDWASLLNIHVPIYLTTDTTWTANHVQKPAREFRDAYGYSHLLEDGSYLVWIDPKIPAHERETTVLHELLHARFPHLSERRIETLATGDFRD